MERLTSLDLSGCEQLSDDLSPLTALSSLQSLDLEGCQHGDLTPLAGLTSLQELILTSWEQLSDLSPMAEPNRRQPANEALQKRMRKSGALRITAHERGRGCLCYVGASSPNQEDDVTPPSFSPTLIESFRKCRGQSDYYNLINRVDHLARICCGLVRKHFPDGFQTERGTTTVPDLNCVFSV